MPSSADDLLWRAWLVLLAWTWWSESAEAIAYAEPWLRPSEVGERLKGNET